MIQNQFIWLRNRINLLVFLITDTIIFLLFFSAKIFSQSLSSQLSTISYLLIYIFWIFGNYVIGKYTLKEGSISIYLFKNLFIFINISFFSYLLLIPFQGISSFKDSNFNSLFTINFISFILIFLINSLYKNRKRNKPFYFLGNTNMIKLLRREVKLSNKRENIILINKKDLKKEIINSKKLIIMESDFKNLKKEISLNNLKPFPLSKWIEKYLQRYPLSLYSEEFFNDILLIDLNTYQLRLKRLSEFIISLVLLILTLPIIIIASIAIFLEDKGPIIYSQDRTGYLNETITIQKLRTLKIESEKEGPQWISKNDSRITKVGQILRKLRIDELPQLISVLKGEMALIGPRPERPQIDDELEKKINHYRKRYYLKPGLSGWAQVNYPYGASVKDAEIKLSYDLYYLRNYSNFLDLLIFVKTIKMVLSGKGSIPMLNK